ncbi:GlmU family protein [Epilithonimonas zeae]|uniref:UDP-N-acetylglucosamine diphosphorylase/glucosamine-1-phosphate N-acetyltransferase n=1 Tax=Epilithonimonas zeae TaxID=1416779 RepID=A0A1N6I9E7_9FLAO|nr:GlmU family protein [Epilithonimonas zeae]SIO28644.1 UDP-N-acetylglucosamine diphosphorylase/glucosamine-1-phosphate N-acetyltransferase [Epilithonimonas zeae]
MQLVFSDAQYWEDFLPLTFTRPVAEMRMGILTFSERWKKLLGIDEVFYITENYLQDKFKKPEPKQSLFIVPNFFPSDEVLKQIKELQPGEALVYENEVLVANINMENFSLNQINKMTDIHEKLFFIEKPTDIFSYNDKAIDYDFKLLTEGRTSQELSSTNGFIGDSENLFIEEGAVIEFSTLNCKTGKIYIGKNAEIMEGSNIRGSLALCEDSKINLGTKLYGGTTIGPHSKVGGEVNNIVIFGYTNKGHDGFVGNSVIGEWCNLGADTNSSNLKNNYASVKLWNYRKKRFLDTGLQFCGLIMGDHSKTAINTQLNTGTVVGVAANIFKSGFPPNLVDSFSWGGMKGDEKFKLEKSYEVAEKAMERRKIAITETDKDILKYIYNEF